MKIFEKYLEILSKNRQDEKDYDFSITELQDSPHRRKLLTKYKDKEKGQEKSAMFMALGSAIHEVLYRVASHEPDKYTVEQRIYGQFGNTIISGKFDLYDKENKELYDYKLTKFYATTLPSRLEEWKYQLNMYRILMKFNNIEVTKINIIAIIRDWADRSDYPETPELHIEIPFIEDSDVIEYINNRIGLHINSTEICSPEERWEEPTKYSVYRIGGNRAVPGGSGFLDHRDAINFIEQKNNSLDYEIRIIAQEPKRCINYCNVSQYCEFYQNWKRENKNGKI